MGIWIGDVSVESDDDDVNKVVMELTKGIDDCMGEVGMGNQCKNVHVAFDASLCNCDGDN